MFGAVGGFDGAGEGVVVAEAVVVGDLDDGVELVADCEISECREWIHGQRERVAERWGVWERERLMEEEKERLLSL